MMGTRVRGHHLTTNPEFSESKRRGAEIDDDVRPFCLEAGNQFLFVERARQIILSPDILTDRDPDFLAGDLKNLATLAWFEVAIFVEDIVCRQERLVALA